MENTLLKLWCCKLGQKHWIYRWFDVDRIVALQSDDNFGISKIMTSDFNRFLVDYSQHDLLKIINILIMCESE